MELKWEEQIAYLKKLEGSNRTFMELKSEQT